MKHRPVLAALLATAALALVGSQAAFADPGHGSGNLVFVHMIRHPVSAYASACWYDGVERKINVRDWADEWRRSVLTAITTEPGPTSTVTYPLPASNEPAPQQEAGTAQRPSGLVGSEISGGGGCAIERRPQRLPAWPVVAAAALLALRRRRRP